MNALEIFQHDSFGSVRTLMENDMPWFVAADICKVLGHSNATMALERLDDDERAKFNLGHPMYETNCVNEYGLYTLVLGSRKSEAKAFKRWITHDVIPAIRRTGSYSTKGAQPTLTAADYLKAAQIMSRCTAANRPYVLSLLESGGIYVEVPVKTEQVDALMEPAEPERPVNVPQRKKRGRKPVYTEADKEVLGEEASRLISECGLSMVKVAQLTGINRDQVSRYKHKWHYPHPERAEHIIKTLKEAMENVEVGA